MGSRPASRTVLQLVSQPDTFQKIRRWWQSKREVSVADRRGPVGYNEVHSRLFHCASERCGKERFSDADATLAVGKKDRSAYEEQFEWFVVCLFRDRPFVGAARLLLDESANPLEDLNRFSSWKPGLLESVDSG